MFLMVMLVLAESSLWSLTHWFTHTKTLKELLNDPFLQVSFNNFRAGWSGPYGGKLESKLTQLRVQLLLLYFHAVCAKPSLQLYLTLLHFLLLFSSFDSACLNSLTLYNYGASLHLGHCPLCIAHCAKCYRFRVSITCKPSSCWCIFIFISRISQDCILSVYFIQKDYIYSVSLHILFSLRSDTKSIPIFIFV